MNNADMARVLRHRAKIIGTVALVALVSPILLVLGVLQWIEYTAEEIAHEWRNP